MAELKEVELFFRPKIDPDQWQYLHPAVRFIFYFLRQNCEAFGCDLVITSMIRPVGSIPGESGVHATGRALDCVPSPKKDIGGPNTYRVYDFSKKLADLANVVFKRADNKLSVIFHNTGSGNHFHIQVPYDYAYQDLKGVKPSGGNENGDTSKG